MGLDNRGSRDSTRWRWEGKLHLLRLLKEAYSVLQLEETLEERPHSLKPDQRRRRCTRWLNVPQGSTKSDLETIASKRRAVLES
ncbi:hypothetical protein NDU88_009211 [Pleurodeles waltl]|uniref:Uncharacterized protein n=1 Tax=Pleurodeles waltl TaxID=8319 RepID=A0AAV7QSX9_PLEWA|nr:hypothetical protein NDU88_009211 [Pleurodeles waltl]